MAAGPHPHDVWVSGDIYQVYRPVRVPFYWNISITDQSSSNLATAFVSGMKEDLSLYGNQLNYANVSSPETRNPVIIKVADHDPIQDCVQCCKYPRAVALQFAAHESQPAMVHTVSSCDNAAVSHTNIIVKSYGIGLDYLVYGLVI